MGEGCCGGHDHQEKKEGCGCGSESCGCHEEKCGCGKEHCDCGSGCACGKEDCDCMTTDDLAESNNIIISALIETLIRKGVINQAELDKEVEAIAAEEDDDDETSAEEASSAQ